MKRPLATIIILTFVAVIGIASVVLFGADQIRQYLILDDISLKNPKMIDGSAPNADIQRSVEEITLRRKNESNWVKRDLDPEEYRFKAKDFAEYLDSIVSVSPSPVTYHLRAGDGQIMGLTYPKRLEKPVEIALRVMKNRSEQDAAVIRQ